MYMISFLRQQKKKRDFEKKRECQTFFFFLSSQSPPSLIINMQFPFLLDFLFIVIYNFINF